VPASSPSGTGYASRAGDALPAGAENNPHAIVAAAAVKWHVPVDVLWGQYGIETNFGKDLSTSSAGARGPFQFIPGTARDYHLTDKTIMQLGPSADAAGHLMHDLYKQYGSWDAAVRHYSGGGYGVREATLKAHSSPGLGDVVKWAGILSPLPGVQISHLLGQVGIGPGSIYDAASSIVSGGGKPSWESELGDFFGSLLKPSTWWRVLEFIAGLVLAFMALRQLAAAGSDPGGGKVLAPPVDAVAAIAGAAA
jgi:Transglycosylase SLT domain